MDNRRWREQYLYAKDFVPTASVRRTVEEFETRVQCTAGAGYGNPTGTGGDVNVLATEANVFEYHMIGTQTIVAPTFGANGLDISLDQTSTDGVELGQGITSRSKAAFVVGNDSFYVEAELSIADVSGATECAIGFRKAAAYAAAIDDYTDMAVLNIQAGTINLETILNNAATDTTDTTKSLADGVTVKLRVNVLSNGKLELYVDDVQVLTTEAFTFDTTDELVPMIHFLHGADLAGAVNLKSYKTGLLNA